MCIFVDFRPFPKSEKWTWRALFSYCGLNPKLRIWITHKYNRTWTNLQLSRVKRLFDNFLENNALKINSNSFWWKFKNFTCIYTLVYILDLDFSQHFPVIFLWIFLAFWSSFHGVTRSTTAVDPQYLKVKECKISLTKNYCINTSIQPISSINKFILKI